MQSQIKNAIKNAINEALGQVKERTYVFDCIAFVDKMEKSLSDYQHLISWEIPDSDTVFGRFTMMVVNANVSVCARVDILGKDFDFPRYDEIKFLS